MVFVAVTVLAVTVKDTDFAPTGTVTLGRTVAADVSELVNVTTTPVPGAVSFRATVPVAVPPLVIVAGFTVVVARTGAGSTVNATLMRAPS